MKIYVAILTTGKVRKELALGLIRWCKDSIHNIFIEFTEEKPISHARNTIVKKFLDSENDYLLQIDDDVVPEKNPLELIEYAKDIIACPAPIYQYGVRWNCYRLDKEKYWVPVDISKEKGLIEVDAVGSGCILIKRNVLEKIKKPFERLFDEVGIEQMGLDLYFSKKAKEKSFNIYVSVDHKCSHYKNIDIKLFV